MVFWTTFKNPQDEWLLKVSRRFISTQLEKSPSNRHRCPLCAQSIALMKYTRANIYYRGHFDWRWAPSSFFALEMNCRRIKETFYIACPKAAIRCDAIKRNIFREENFHYISTDKKAQTDRKACVIDCRTQHFVVNFNINAFCLQPIIPWAIHSSYYTFAWNW